MSELTPKQIQRRLMAFTAFAVVSVIAVLLLVMSIGYQRLAELDEEREHIIERQITRAYLLTEMRDVIRQRAIHIRNMLIDPDPFARDEAYMAFLASGERYMKLRTQLSDSALPAELAASLDELYAVTAEGSTILVKTAELALAGQTTEAAVIDFLERGKEIQTAVVDQLSRIVEAQAASTRSEIVGARSREQSASHIVLLLILLGLATVVVMTIYTLRHVARLGGQLEAQTERAQASSRAKSAFLANISHEIRTPVHGVLGMMDLLDGTRLNGEQRDFIGTARESTRALLNILNDVLDLSKAEADKLSLQPAPFDLLETIERVMEMLAGVATGKGVMMFAYVDASVPDRVVGDAGRIRQILTNLLGNAIKFTDHGEVWLNIRAQRDGKRLTLSFGIHDTGVGIREEDQAKLFQAFGQAGNAAGHRVGGTGLGLVISKKLAMLMNGDIRFSSSAGRGTTFRVRLELETEPGHQSREWPPRLPSRKVMLITRYPHFRVWLAKQMQDWGLEVTGCSTMAEGLYRLDNDFTPELVLVDEDLPGIDAADVEEQISARSGGRRIPVLRFAAAGLSAGSDAASLRRPIHPRRLLQGLQSMADPMPRLSQQTLLDSAPKPGLGMRVLSVDDNPINQTVMRLLLERLGCAVHVAGNGNEAVDRFTMQPFDLVLMDAYMPEMDGYEATRLIREIEAQRHAKSTPVYGVSASVHESDRHRALDAGMNAMLGKPIGSDELGELLKQVSAGRSRAPVSSGLRDWYARGGLELPTESAQWRAFERFKQQFSVEWPSIVEDFLAQAELALTEIRSEDGQRVANSAHRLRGAASAIGLLRVVSLAKFLETAAREGRDLSKVLFAEQGVFALLREEIDAVQLRGRESGQAGIGPARATATAAEPERLGDDRQSVTP